MSVNRSAPPAAAVGLCLLLYAAFRGATSVASRWLPLAAATPAVPPPHSPCQAAEREARRYRLRAELTAIRQREALDAWDPAAVNELNQEVLRRQFMTGDPQGNLRRALGAGRRAAALARTPDDAYEAAMLLFLLECDAGNVAAQRAQARKLVALRPDDPMSHTLLWQAKHPPSLWRHPVKRRSPR